MEGGAQELYRVTPKNSTDGEASPMDFDTLEEAVEYADSLGCDFEIKKL